MCILLGDFHLTKSRRYETFVWCQNDCILFHQTNHLDLFCPNQQPLRAAVAQFYCDSTAMPAEQFFSTGVTCDTCVPWELECKNYYTKLKKISGPILFLKLLKLIQFIHQQMHIY